MLTLLGHTGRVHSVAFSPDGTLLASHADDGTVRLWNVPAGTLRSSLQLGDRSSRAGAGMAFAPDGTLYAIDAGTAQLWRVGDGTLLRVLDGTAAGVSSVAVAPVGRLLAVGAGWSGRHEPLIQLWDAVDGRLMHTLPEQHTGAVHSLAFSPDGTLLAAGDEHVRLWRVADGALVQTLPAAPEAALVCGLAFAPDGTTLAAGSGDNAVRLWRVRDGRLRYALIRPAAAGYVRSVVFSPDGRLLAAGMSASGAVQVWRIPEGTLVRIPDGPMGGVSGVAFSPDGALLAWGAADGTVYVWPVPQA
jgi:WD40 repeat protein